jgi:alpha-L-rhamnosidase
MPLRPPRLTAFQDRPCIVERTNSFNSSYPPNGTPELSTSTGFILPTLAGLLLSAGALAAAPATLHPTHLRVEYQTDPLALDVAQPRLSWTLESPGRAQKQSAWQVLVASTESELAAGRADVWNSGKVHEDRNFHVVYQGAALASGRRYYWKVRVWDASGQSSAWSRPARWQMGLLNPADWQGQWIGPPADAPSPLLRKDFRLSGAIRRATAHVVGLGWYELRLNGRKAGDLILAPVNSNYKRVLYYDTYDVTGLLRPGGNTVGLWLGNGYNDNYSKWGYRHGGPQRARLQLDIEYADGHTASVVTDGTWRTAPSPITANDIYNGESYDARLESPGWDTFGYAAAERWTPVTLAPAPDGALKSRLMPPIRAGQPIRPQKMTQPKPGVYVFDLGQNIAGFARIRVHGPAGTAVTLRHAEDLNPDGTLDTTTNRAAKATDTFTLKGGATELYQPRFTYHGFRYVELSGWPGVPTLRDLEGIPVHADVAPAGTFESSHPLLNRIHSNFRWSILNNLMGIPTDTATRDERTPCQMDSVVVEDAAIHNFDMDQYYTKWLADIAGEQSIPVWSGDQVFLPMRLYQYYGDRRTLEQQYPNIRTLVEHFSATAAAQNHWAGGFGDWCPPGPGGYKGCFSEGELTDTAVYYQTVVYAAECARLLGQSDDEARFTRLAASIRSAFNARHYHADSHTYSSGRQVSSVLPLAFGLVPEDQRAAVAGALAERVEHTDHTHLDTGIFGTRYLFDVLLDHGYADLAFNTLTQTTAPGYGHQIGLGATTNWEQWAYKVSMETHDHAMFAGPGATLYTHLAGIQPAAPGYKEIVIRPRIPAGLTHVRASLRTVMGLVESEWDTRQGYTQRVTLPANATATVYVPAASARQVSVPGGGARFLRMEDGCALFAVGSGHYEFIVRAGR